MTRTQRTYVVAAAVAAIVTAANASQGAYFSQSWGWVALAFLVPMTVLLIVDRVDMPGRLRVAFAAFMVALVIWIGLSAIWSISTAASIREVERALVYVATALAIALVLRRGDGSAVLAGVAIGGTLICGYALATRLLPDRLDTYDDAVNSYRLAAPIGYWNSLGLLATMTLLTALGFVAHARRTVLSLASAIAIPVVVTTLYFTYSRGAWGALIVGLVVAVAADPRRIRLIWTTLVVVVPVLLCIAYASTLDALTTENAPPPAAERQGHQLALVLLATAAVTVLLAWVARWVSRRVDVRRRGRRVFDGALVAGAVAVVVAALVAAGGPSAAVDELQQRFHEHVATADLNNRLFSVAGNGRTPQYRVAWAAGRESPIVGHGSGTFEYLWYERRSTLLIVRDGHSLYLETFAELGLVGLTLLVCALLTLAAAAVLARRHRFIATGFGAFAAWCAAAAVDWHWEVVGVTSTALLAGGAALVVAERPGVARLDSRARVVLVSACAALSFAAVWSLVGNQALFAGREALARGDWADARQHARRAHALLFWSAEPDIVRGDAAAGLGDREAALKDYRAAVAADPRGWAAWLRLAQVSRGAERAAAYRRVHELNPRERDLPGE